MLKFIKIKGSLPGLFFQSSLNLCRLYAVLDQIYDDLGTFLESALIQAAFSHVGKIIHMLLILS